MLATLRRVALQFGAGLPPVVVGAPDRSTGFLPQLVGASPHPLLERLFRLGHPGPLLSRYAGTSGCGCGYGRCSADAQQPVSGAALRPIAIEPGAQLPAGLEERQRLLLH
jgi:hypothetical protein